MLFLYAAKSGDMPTVLELFAKGAQINFESRINGFTALMYGAMAGDEALVTWLLEHNPNVNQMKPLFLHIFPAISTDETDSETNYTALHFAARYGNDAIVKILLDEGANPNLKNYEGQTPSDLATESCKKLFGIKDVTERNAHVTNQNKMFLAAVELGDVARMKYLISKGADIDCVDGNGLTALLIIAKSHVTNYRIRKMAEALLDLKPNMNYRSKEGDTALHFAVELRHSELVNMLLSYGANPKLKNYHGKTPFWRETIQNVEELNMMLLAEATARGSKNYNRIHKLIERGAEVDSADTSGKTTLHYAAMTGDKSLVKLMLKRGANVNCLTCRKNTPLHFAVACGYSDIKDMLISRGADILKNIDGETPLGFARVQKGETDFELF